MGDYEIGLLSQEGFVAGASCGVEDEFVEGGCCEAWAGE